MSGLIENYDKCNKDIDRRRYLEKKKVCGHLDELTYEYKFM